jgi:glycerate-2-kinase
MSSKQLLHNAYFRLLDEIRPEALISKALTLEGNQLTINNQSFEIPHKISLLGSGKGVLPMAHTLHEQLSDRIDQPLLVGAYATNELPPNTTYIQGSHPIPSQQSIEGAKALIQALEALDEDDFFIYLLSGGNSALVELPVEPITLEEFQRTTDLMIKGAMPIEAINSVRKHLSQVKGGHLAKHTKARGVVLVLSDVLGDDLQAIGSAPLYYDASTFDDAINHLKEYQIWERLPKSVQSVLTEQKEETLKKPNPNIPHHIIGSNQSVLNEMNRQLNAEGIETTIQSQSIEGDVNKVAERLSNDIQMHRGSKHAYLYGGEATVNVQGQGKGGRNQHLALLMLKKLQSEKEVTILCASTDGIDGNSKAAGALIDNHSVINAQARNLSIDHYIEHFDSNHFFQLTSELIQPGATHNNLLDLVVVLIDT